MPRVNRIPPKKLHPSKCPLLSGWGLGTGLSVEVEGPVVVVAGLVGVVVVVVLVVMGVVVEVEEEEVVVEVVLAVVTAVVVVVVVVVVVSGVMAVKGSSPPELQFPRMVMMVGWTGSSDGV